VGIDVGVDTDGDGRLDAKFAGYVVNPGELGLAFNVKGENAALQRKLDLRLSLPDAGENTAFHISASREYAPEFATAHEVKGGTETCKVPKHSEAGIGLHRVT
jgi:hypothetical protein